MDARDSGTKVEGHVDQKSHALGWQALPIAARCYVAAVLFLGAYMMATSWPLHYPRPLMFGILLLASCITSSWKVNLPGPLSSGSTLSVSYAADLAALMLLGPEQAVIVALAGVLTQCTFNVRQPYPLYRTAFSVAAEAITILSTGRAYTLLGGTVGLLATPALPRAIAGTIATYFLVNSALMAGAIGLSTRRSLWRVWRDDLLWSAPSFMVAGAAGALAAVTVARGSEWSAMLMAAPIYLTYRTYRIYLGRIEDEQRHLRETQRLHREALEALSHAKAAEQALATEKERLAVTLRSIGDGVIAADLDGTIRLMNNVAESVTGWTQDDAAGRPLAEVFQNFCPDTRERCDTSPSAAAERAPSSRSTILVARDLSERPIEEITAPVRDIDGRTIGMVVAFRDVTEALKMREERANANRVASLGLLAGGIAHDFNNILMSVMGNISIARARAAGGDAHTSALAEAERACGRARQLTWQLLTFSRGGVPFKKTIALPPVLEESASLALRGSTTTCDIHASSDLTSISADESQLVQVFSNVLINAQQAMPNGGRIEIRAENIIEPGKRWECAAPVEPGLYARVSIVDTGIGISEEQLGRIFDPYFTTKQQGRGLGLATAYSIVKNHGGYISVESKVGQGTTLHVNFPAAMTRERDVTPDTVRRDRPRRGRILVMDDEISVRMLTTNMLGFLGHEAASVGEGLAAVRRYKRALAKGQPFDAVILDLTVPNGIGGRETMALLNELDPGVTAIVTSGYALDPVMTNFREYGFKAVIAKPFTLQELNHTLNVAMVPSTRTIH
ncbi:MAG TPA: ATP-binding protein [Vicinamibacterales bacterium]|jgi:PAS domain S-box-containing protein